VKYYKFVRSYSTTSDALLAWCIIRCWSENWL